MQSNEKIQAIRKLLPWGAKTEIAKTANVSLQTIRNFFDGKTKRRSVNEAILKASIDYLNEMNQIRQDLLDSLK